MLIFLSLSTALLCFSQGKVISSHYTVLPGQSHQSAVSSQQSAGFLLKLTRIPLERAWLDDEDYRDTEADDYSYQGELEAPRAEAMMEVEFLEKEKEIGPSLGRVLSPS